MFYNIISIKYIECRRHFQSRIQDVLRVLPLYISGNVSTVLSICLVRRVSTQSVRLSDISPPNTFALAGL